MDAVAAPREQGAGRALVPYRGKWILEDTCLCTSMAGFMCECRPSVLAKSVSNSLGTTYMHPLLRVLSLRYSTRVLPKATGKSTSGVNTTVPKEKEQEGHGGFGSSFGLSHRNYSAVDSLYHEAEEEKKDCPKAAASDHPAILNVWIPGGIAQKRMHDSPHLCCDKIPDRVAHETKHGRPSRALEALHCRDKARQVLDRSQAADAFLPSRQLGRSYQVLPATFSCLPAPHNLIRCYYSPTAASGRPAS